MFDFRKLINAAIAGHEQNVVEQLDDWSETGGSKLEPLNWLNTISDLKDRKHVAGVLARLSAESGDHDMIETLLESSDRSVLAGVISPANDIGYTTAHFAVDGDHHKVIEALARSRDKPVRDSLVMRSKRDQFTPADMAAKLGRSSVITALGSAGGAALASLAQPNPKDGLTPAQRAEVHHCRGVVEALKRTNDPTILKTLPAPLSGASSSVHYTDLLRKAPPSNHLPKLPPSATQTPSM